MTPEPARHLPASDNPSALAAADAPVIGAQITLAPWEYNPLVRANRTLRIMWWVCGALLASSATFALLPIRGSPLRGPTIEPEPFAPKPERAPLLITAFQAPIWSKSAPTHQPPPPPPPPQTPAPKPVSPPPRVLLLGIEQSHASGDAVYCAVLYDTDSERVVRVGSGDAVGPRRVLRVEPDRVLLVMAESNDDTTVAALELNPAHATGTRIQGVKP